jgi:transposase InsO family protein
LAGRLRYNPRRRYSALGYRSPMNVEWQHCDKASTQTMTIDYEQRA